jgi:hypothetical protein
LEKSAKARSSDFNRLAAVSKQKKPLAGRINPTKSEVARCAYTRKSFLMVNASVSGKTLAL